MAKPIKGSFSFATLIVLALGSWFLPNLRVSAAEDYDSLYAQMAAANSGNDTISLSEDITLRAPLPPIRDEITIEGNGHTIDGDGKYRIFDVVGGRMTITNLTLTGGKAPGEEAGGAIRMRNSARVTIADSAFANNAADRGGAIYADNGTVSITNSSFAGNFAFADGGVINAQGATVNITNSSFIADGSCSPKLSGDPMLAVLTGSPAGHPLQAGSTAIDAANADLCLETDQIGRPRPLGGGCDIGAIEAIPPVRILSDCHVTTTHGLNFRDGPQGNRIGIVSQNMTLVASARTPNWFNVEHDGISGWISADYVVTEGDCE